MIERALDQMRTESIIARLDPDNPECPGCGRRAVADTLTYPTQLLDGSMRLCCAECADDWTSGMDLDEYRADLVANWQPLSHHAISTRYRGIMLPPGFYDEIETRGS